eukprot:scaffold97860_cov33-Tisochrysis_lutea.AAC.3
MFEGAGTDERLAKVRKNSLAPWAIFVQTKGPQRHRRPSARKPSSGGATAGFCATGETPTAPFYESQANAPAGATTCLSAVVPTP